LIILGLALGIASRLHAIRSRKDTPRETQRANRNTAIAFISGGVISVIVVSSFLLDRTLFDPGSVVRHSTLGKPPVFGFVGIALSAILYVALSLDALRRRRVGVAQQL